jgi:hypothetical protein
MQEDQVQDKIQQLVRQLISGTQNGKILWTNTSDEDAFRANFKGGKVRVQKTIRLDEAEHEVVDFSLTLLDQQGKELEDYYPEPLSPQNDLIDLWTLARRSARSTVDVLENLLREVGSENRTGG